jgi:uncharacterized protein YdhG (YjbR/CyaY superfamily)
VTKSTTSITPKDIDEYLAQVPRDARTVLEKLRQTIRTAAPKAVEVISYQIPTFKLDGRLLVCFAAFKNHCSFFPGAAVTKDYQKELKNYHTSKGTIRFSPDQPLPAAFVKKLVKARVAEHQARAIQRDSLRVAKASKG